MHGNSSTYSPMQLGHAVTFQRKMSYYLEWGIEPTTFHILPHSRHVHVQYISSLEAMLCYYNNILRQRKGDLEYVATGNSTKQVSNLERK